MKPIKNLGKVMRQLTEHTEQQLPQAVARWLNIWGLRIAGDAQRRLTRAGGGRDTGRLAGSIAQQVEHRGDMVELRVGTNVEYAKFVEGYPKVPRRHFLPFARHPDFAGWAHRRLKLSWSQIDSRPHVSTGARRHRVSGGAKRAGTSDWKSRKKIRGFMVGGKAWPFLRPAFKKNIGRMRTDLRRIATL